jgi:hypothetical protein
MGKKADAAKVSTTPPDRGKKSQGMHWCRDEKRYALYVTRSDQTRGPICIWCLRSKREHGITLTLDHVVPYTHRGPNSADNLVVACKVCNCKRKDRSIATFAQSLVGIGPQAQAILQRIDDSRAIPLTRADVQDAKARIAEAGGFTQACRAL